MSFGPTFGLHFKPPRLNNCICRQGWQAFKFSMGSKWSWGHCDAGRRQPIHVEAPQHFIRPL
eukprot:11048987-Alexandrium_andersonii.AAC.1